MPDNIFEDLGATLKDLRTYLDDEISVIQPAVAALRSIVPDQIDGLLGGLAELLAALKLQLQQIDASAVPGLQEAAGFALRVGTLVGAARPLLPQMSTKLDTLSGHASVIVSLPALDAIKPQLLGDITAIEAHVASLQP